MASLIFYFRIYVYGLFCQHVYKKTKRIEKADVYMCAKCWRAMALQNGAE